MATNDVIQKIEKTLNNTHTTTQKPTNNSFRNTKKHPEKHNTGTIVDTHKQNASRKLVCPKTFVYDCTLDYLVFLRFFGVGLGPLISCFPFVLFVLFFFPWTPAQEKRYGLNEVNEHNYFLPEKLVRILFHYFKDKEQILFAENDFFALDTCNLIFFLSRVVVRRLGTF